MDKILDKMQEEMELLRINILKMDERDPTLYTTERDRFYLDNITQLQMVDLLTLKRVATVRKSLKNDGVITKGIIKAFSKVAPGIDEADMEKRLMDDNEFKSAVGEFITEYMNSSSSFLRTSVLGSLHYMQALKPDSSPIKLLQTMMKKIGITSEITVQNVVQKDPNIEKQKKEQYEVLKRMYPLKAEMDYDTLVKYHNQLIQSKKEEEEELKKRQNVQSYMGSAGGFSTTSPNVRQTPNP